MGKKIIYLDDAIDAIRALWDGAPTAQHVSAMFDCEDALQALPSAQLEIIHCQHCEKYGTKFCAMDIWTDQVTIRRAKPNDFCSKAKRRIDG